MLPQWMPLSADVEAPLQRALASRRLKLNLHLHAVRGAVTAHGTVGTPIAELEWGGARRRTAAAAAPSLTARFDEHFPLLLPASMLYPPCRCPLGLAVLDGAPHAQRNGEAPMGSCELPLGALLLADELQASCTLRRDATAAPVAAPPAELLLSLGTLHVGAPHPDDASPGVPLARRHALRLQARA
eukprot:7047282-Prymnesium_polylepis.1